MKRLTPEETNALIAECCTSGIMDCEFYAKRVMDLIAEKNKGAS